MGSARRRSYSFRNSLDRRRSRAHNGDALLPNSGTLTGDTFMNSDGTGALFEDFRSSHYMRFLILCFIVTLCKSETSSNDFSTEYFCGWPFSMSDLSEEITRLHKGLIPGL